jgi:predicted  nucleic acid-binding Zn-ribbon protein
MGRKRKPNLEIEFELEREIKDLKQEITKLKKQLRDLKKLEDSTKKEPSKVTPSVKLVKKECPKCGAFLISSELPFGIMDICESTCGYRNVSVTKKSTK